ncbi:MAG: pseudouridine synthase [Faecousia sp.]
MAERLQKILAERGVCSRRKAETLIREGRVRLNGAAAHLGDTARPEQDVIEVDGVRLGAAPESVVLMVNKPRGYVCTASDERGRKTVLELAPERPERLYPVGRLDMYSEGLLLLTNDGALAQKLTHPAQQIEKVYHLWVSGFTPGAERRLERPIVLDGRPICPPGVRLLHQSGGTAMLEITIHEGRNRQIRRMCQSAGLTVTRLKRIREGRLSLGGLEPGCWRLLTAQEQEYLNSL